MAKADDYANWIVKNQHRKGSDEFDTVAEAYKQAKEEESTQFDMSDYGYKPPQQTAQDRYSQTAQSQSFGKNLAAGAGGMAYGLGYLGPKSLVGMDQPGEVADWKQSMAGLSGTAGGMVGSVLGGAGVGVPMMMMPGGQTLPGAALAGAGMGAITPAESASERMQNIGLGGAGGLGGQMAGRMFAGRLAAKNSELAARQAENQVKDETIRMARDNNLVMTPSMLGKPSLLESIGGQIKTQQAASWKNQPTINDMARAEFGLPKGTPLTSDTMNAIRKEANKVYGEVAGLGRIQISRNQSGGIMQSGPTVDANDLVNNVRQLRHDGFNALSSYRQTGNPEMLAESRRMLAESKLMEDLLDSHLQSTGKIDLMNRFVDARKTIAKTHSLEDAIRNATGDINPRELGNQFEEGMKGVGPKLTGKLSDIGRFAGAFDEAARMRSWQPLPNSPLDVATSVIAGSGASTPTGLMAAGIPFLREPVRNILMTRTMQNRLMPTYQAGSMTRLMGSEPAQMLERTLPISASLLYGTQE